MYNLSFAFISSVFTFHYVSINICVLSCNKPSTTIFTFHYVSINIQPRHLDSLLQRDFTFHYVSINMPYGKRFESLIIPLHSTMYLLISISISYLTWGYTSLHSTMYLLISYQPYKHPWGIPFFTFHYVSINIWTNYWKEWNNMSLHSTMYLLISNNLIDFDTPIHALHSTMYLLI